MLQLRLILFGAALIGGIGLAVYHHFNSQHQHQQQHSYGPRPDDSDAGRSVPINNCNRLGANRRRKPRSKDSTCSICLSNVTPQVERVLECGHIFHVHCIKVWFDMFDTIQNASCPNCRKNVNR